MDKLYAIINTYDTEVNIRAVTKNFDSAVKRLCDDVWESILCVRDWYDDPDHNEHAKDNLPKSREELFPGLEWKHTDVKIIILPDGIASLDYGLHHEDWFITELPEVMD